MALHAHPAPDLHDLSLGIDEEGVPLGPEDLLPEEDLRLLGIVGSDGAVIGIREEEHREVVLLGELHVALGRIGGHPDDLGPEGGELLKGLRELDGLEGAARSVVPGVEVEHHPLPAVVFQADLLSPGIREAERGGLPSGEGICFGSHKDQDGMIPEGHKDCLRLVPAPAVEARNPCPALICRKSNPSLGWMVSWIRSCRLPLERQKGDSQKAASPLARCSSSAEESWGRVTTAGCSREAPPFTPRWTALNMRAASGPLTTGGRSCTRPFLRATCAAGQPSCTGSRRS